MRDVERLIAATVAAAPPLTREQTRRLAVALPPARPREAVMAA
ncbi:hypothetical protein [Micromonospora sp. NPDC050495]